MKTNRNFSYQFPCLILILFRYRGTYCSQDVAIKVLNPERVDVDLQQEFAHEVFIMRLDTFNSFLCIVFSQLSVLSTAGA